MKIRVTESPDYKKDLKKLKDKVTKEELYKKIQKILSNPERAKHLKNVLKLRQSERIGKFRLIYEWKEEGWKLNLLRFRKRG